jgi:hypothetical protein
MMKLERSQRDVPMCLLAADLATRYPGPEHAEEYMFGVRTHVAREKKGGGCDDRAINQDFLRPAAIAVGVYYIAVGVYYKGFGFHSFRREAVSELAKSAGANQAQRMLATPAPISVSTTRRRTWMLRPKPS